MPPPDIFKNGLPTLTAKNGVHLRAVRSDDAFALYAVFGDAETLRYWSHEPFASKDDAVAYVEAIDRGVAHEHRYQWAIAADDDDALIGTVTLNNHDAKHRRCEVGFILRRDQHGKGRARAAVAAVLAFAYDDLDVHRVEADVDPDNVASLKLLRSLGFVDEGFCAERWFVFGEWKHAQLLGLLAKNAPRSTW